MRQPHFLAHTSKGREWGFLGTRHSQVLACGCVERVPPGIASSLTTMAGDPHALADGSASLLYFSLGLISFARVFCVHGLKPLNKQKVFHLLLVLFAASRTATLWSGLYDSTAYTAQVVLDRISFSLFFSLLSFLVVQWCVCRCRLLRTWLPGQCLTFDATVWGEQG